MEIPHATNLLYTKLFKTIQDKNDTQNFHQEKKESPDGTYLFYFLPGFLY